MANGDYGYFGKGDTGYAQYMTAFNRNFGGSSGGGGGGSHNNGGGGGDGSGCGCLIAIAVVVVQVLLGMGSLGHTERSWTAFFLTAPNRFMLHITTI